MSNDNDSGFGRTFTHVRAIAFDAAPLPTPEIRALARIDIEVHANAVAYCPPTARRFATLTDERTARFVPCTPAILAQTIWTENVPAALIGWGAATWDIFCPAFTRGIPRIDLLKIARLAWPDEDVRDPVALATRTGFRRPPAEVGQTVARRTADRVQAIADLFGAVVTLVGDGMIARVVALDNHGTQPPPTAAFGKLRGDARLEALVRLSAEPMAPYGYLPGPWDDASVWFAMASEDLAWLASATSGDDGFDFYAGDEARAELARRQARDAALLRPRSLLRQPSPD
jgi:hypothetical protein